MIKVLIVDDEPLARENLRILLQEQSDIEIVGECANAVEAIGASTASGRAVSGYSNAAYQRAGNGGYARPGASAVYCFSDRF